MYFYQSLNRQNIAQCVEFISLNFIKDEPMAKCLEFDLANFVPLADMICEHALNEDLSLVAFNQSDKKIVGAIIGYDFSRNLPVAHNLCSKFSPILKLLKELDEIVAPQLETLKVNYVSLMALDYEHRSKALFSEIMQNLADKSVRQGYTHFYSQETSEYRFRISSFPGTVSEMAYTNYRDFVFNGEKPFSSLPGRCVAIKTSLNR